MNKGIKQQIRQCTLATMLLLISQPIFASGHLPDLGSVFLVVALLFLGTSGVALLAFLFALKYRQKQSLNYQVAAWALALPSLAVALYFVRDALIPNEEGSYGNSFSHYEIYAALVPLVMSLGSIFLLLVKPGESRLPEELSNSGEAGNNQPTELNKLQGKWIQTFKVFVFVSYPYKILRILTVLSFTLQNHGVNTANVHGNTLLTLRTVISFLSLLIAPGILYFMIKRSKWCWVLLCADSVFAGIPLVFFLFTFSPNSLFIITAIIELALLFFIWLDEVGAYLNITRQEKMKYTIAIGIVGLVLVMARIVMPF